MGSYVLVIGSERASGHGGTCGIEDGVRGVGRAALCGRCVARREDRDGGRQFRGGASSACEQVAAKRVLCGGGGGWARCRAACQTGCVAWCDVERRRVEWAVWAWRACEGPAIQDIPERVWSGVGGGRQFRTSRGACGAVWAAAGSSGHPGARVKRRARCGMWAATGDGGRKFRRLGGASSVRTGSCEARAVGDVPRRRTQMVALIS